VMELATGTLQLPLNVDLCRAEVHVRPGKAECLTAAQAQDQDEDTRRIQRIGFAAS
jgi:hypothetical protein